MMLPEVETLIGLLRERAERSPDTTAFEFAGTGVTFSGLWAGINAFAAHLAGRGVKAGDRVVILLGNGPEFFEAFYGAQRIGAVAVPLFPGLGIGRVEKMAQLCLAKAVIFSDNISDAHFQEFQRRTDRHKLRLVRPGDVAADGTETGVIEPSATDIAYIQYTSGSTGNPKGVMVSHANLLTNMRQMIAGMHITGDDIFVSWLPVYHDMGLILTTMVPFYVGADLHLMETDLRHVGRWLRAIEDNRATFTAAPDFAYRLCLRQIRDPSRFDLSSLRMALNAAEPVRRKTIVEFESAFGLSDVLVPAYGLAEATVGVTCWPPGQPIKADEKANVSAGRPFDGVEIEIVTENASVSPGEIGEIAVRGPALPRGYFDNAAATRALFRREDQILTGDLGYVDHDGDLFIVGRRKNVIHQAGRTLYSREVEEVVEDLPAIRLVAAVGIDRQRLEGEQIYVFAEARPAAVSTAKRCQTIIRLIVARIFDNLGIRPGRVYLLKPKSIPVTPNGKMRHQRLSELFADGALAAGGHIVYPDY